MSKNKITPQENIVPNQNAPSTRSITPFVRNIITLTVMLVAVVEVLDMTIVNVSLPNMMGSLGANTDQITWVLTSYIVSAAILMPMTGFLIKRLGLKKLLLLNIIGFLIASMLCGIASSFTAMVFFRTCQGLFGAGLVPISQTVLRDIYTREEQGKAMAIWGMGIMTGPILGPTLGGLITEHLSWRWIFYINLPVCVLAFFLSIMFIPNYPKQQQRIDWTGLILCSLGVACLQLFLDRGNVSDWFSSPIISLLCITWVLAFAIFISRGIREKENNFINLALFQNKNFSLGSFLLMAFTLGMLGLLALQPIMMENLMGYPTLTTGLLMAPRGIASAFGMMIVGKLNRRVDSRIIAASGLLLSAAGTYAMSHFNLSVSESDLIITAIIQGFGMGFFFVPIAMLSFTTLSPTLIPEAAGIYSFARSLGSAIGISIFSTLISRETQINWSRLAGSITPFNQQLNPYNQTLGNAVHTPLTQMVITQKIANQSGMVSFIDAFELVVIIFLALVPLVFCLTKEKYQSAASVEIH